MRKYIGILSGWDRVQPEDLSDIKDKGLLTIPELLKKIQNIELKLSEIDQLKKILQEHISDNTNPHGVKIEIENCNITYMLYKEYIERFGFTGTFEDFVIKLYRFLELAQPEDLNDIDTNKLKLVTLETAKALIDIHNNDPNAHKELWNTIFPGEPVKSDVPILTNNDLDLKNIQTNKYNNIIQPENNKLLSTQDNIQNQICYFFNDIWLHTTGSNLINTIETSNCNTINVNSDNDWYTGRCHIEEGYTIIQEDNTESEKDIYLVRSNNFNIAYYTLNFIVRPILRNYINIHLDNTFDILIDLQSNKILEQNGNIINTDIYQLNNNWLWIVLSFKVTENINTNKIKITIKKFPDQNTYIGENQYAIGIYEPTLYYGLYKIGINDIPQFQYKIDLTQDIRNIIQGFIGIKFKYPLLSIIQESEILESKWLDKNNNYKYIKITQDNSNINFVFTDTINNKNINQNVKINNKASWVYISWSDSGIIIGTDEILRILPYTDGNYIVDVNLDAILEYNDNPYLGYDFITKLSEFPFQVKFFNNLNSSIEFLTTYYYSYIKMYKDNNTVVKMDLWQGGFQETLYPKTILPDDNNLFNSYLTVGGNINNLIEELIVYDIALIPNNVMWLLGKTINITE